MYYIKIISKFQLAIVLTFFIVTAVAMEAAMDDMPKTMNWLEDPSTCRPCTDNCFKNSDSNMCCMMMNMNYTIIEKV